MSRIYERSLIIIINKDEISAFEKFVNEQFEINRLNIFNILSSADNCLVSLEVSQSEIVKKYSTQFLNSIKGVEIKDENKLIFEYCNIFARDVSHLFKNHVEIELLLSIDHRIQTDIDYRIFATELAKSLKIKMTYMITDFEHYDLILHNRDELKIRISNIESLNNEIELIEAIKLMTENVAAHNKP